MGSSEDFLPRLIFMEDYGSEWNQYLEVLYEFFCQDFITSKPSFQGKRFGMKRHPLTKNKEATFWHIISEGEVESERLPDLRRCERIRWPRVMIEAAENGDVRIKWWRTRRNLQERIVIALEDFSYVVILAERSDYVLLWTAFCVKPGHQREKLRREFEMYLRQNG